MNQKLHHTLALLREAAELFQPAALASSFSAEDMVLTDLIVRHDLAVGVFTLDTGRLHEETYRLMQRVRERYGLAVAVFAPERADLESYVAAHGPNAMYDSIALREVCCRLRKVEPLKKVLAGYHAWITGIRREQSPTRAHAEVVEWDDSFGLVKLNPLAHWTHDQVWSYIRERNVPYNPLHDRQYPSIGCQPCTGPVKPGQDFRAGRWSGFDKTECGLHPNRKGDPE